MYFWLKFCNLRGYWASNRFFLLSSCALKALWDWLLKCPHIDTCTDVNIKSNEKAAEATSLEKNFLIKRRKSGLKDMAKQKSMLKKKKVWLTHVLHFLSLQRRTACTRAWSSSIASATTSGSRTPQSSCSSTRRTCLRRRSRRVLSPSATRSMQVCASTVPSYVAMHCAMLCKMM